MRKKLEILALCVGLLFFPVKIANACNKQDKERILKQIEYDRIFYFQENEKYIVKRDDIKEEHREYMKELKNQEKYDELKTFHIYYDLDRNGIIDLKAEFEIRGIIFNDKNEIEKINMNYAAKKVWIDKDEDGHFEKRYSNNNDDIYLEERLPLKGSRCKENIFKKIENQGIFRYDENLDYLIKRKKLQRDPCGEINFFCAEYDLNGDNITDLKAKFRISQTRKKGNKSIYFFENKAKCVYIDKEGDGVFETVYLDTNDNGTLETRRTRDVSNCFESM